MTNSKLYHHALACVLAVVVTMTTGLTPPNKLVELKTRVMSFRPVVSP